MDNPPEPQPAWVSSPASERLLIPEAAKIAGAAANVAKGPSAVKVAKEATIIAEEASNIAGAAAKVSEALGTAKVAENAAMIAEGAADEPTVNLAAAVAGLMPELKDDLASSETSAPQIS